MRFTIKVSLLFLFCILQKGSTFSQTLIINEVSQGPSGSKEYVELLVVPSQTPNPCGNVCLNLIHWILDDNNGYFSNGPSAGEGVADGCIRFTNDPLWSCIPVGTKIIIYNTADLNASVPAQDISMQDNNCQLVIPITSTLFEKHLNQPSVANGPNYPSTGFQPGGNWSNISMANSDDSFQIYSSSNSLVPVHAVSWGNNNVNNMIYFNGSATNKVFSFTNNISSNPNLQGNWTSGTCSAPNDQTPGLGNNAQNIAYINTIGNNCGPIPTVMANLTVTTPASCTCNATINANPSGGNGYTYVWMNAQQAPIGQNTASANNLCSGLYYCQVTTANGCVLLDSILVPNLIPVVEPTFNPFAAICQNTVAPALPLVSSNGITGTWNPPVINVGTVGVTAYVFTPNPGPCSDTVNLWITISNGSMASFSISDTVCVFSNSTLPVLSNNGILGTWNPPTINTNVSGMSNYVFTPQAGQCASGTNMNIYVLDSVAPSFFYFGTYCINEQPLALEPVSLNGIVGSWTPPVVSTLIQGVSFYTFTPQAGYNCVSSLTINQLISDSIVPQFTQLGPFCVGEVVAPLPSPSLQGIMGSWSPPTVNTSTVGTYNFVYTTIPMACTSAGSMTIVVDSLQVNAGNDTSLCQGSLLTLQGSGATNYAWNNGIQNNTPFQVNTTQNYTLTGTTGTCTDTDDLVVTVFPAPTANINCSVDGTMGTFQNNTGLGVNYFWDFGDNSNATGNTLASETHNYALPGNYQIQMIATSNNGCTDTTYCTIYIAPIIPPQPEVPLIIEIPNVFSPNNDFNNETYSLNLIGDSTFTVLILNRWGQEVASLNETNPSWDGKSQGQDCVAGVYFIVYNVNGKNGEIKEGHSFLHLIR